MNKLLFTREFLQPRYAKLSLSHLRFKHLKASVKRLVDHARLINNNVNVHIVDREATLSAAHHTRLV